MIKRYLVTALVFLALGAIWQGFAVCVRRTEA